MRNWVLKVEVGEIAVIAQVVEMTVEQVKMEDLKVVVQEVPEVERKEKVEEVGDMEMKAVEGEMVEVVVMKAMVGLEVEK